MAGELIRSEKESEPGQGRKESLRSCVQQQGTPGCGYEGLGWAGGEGGALEATAYSTKLGKYALGDGTAEWRCTPMFMPPQFIR